MSGADERLGAELEALLDAERQAPAPSGDVQARVWSGVEKKIATGAAPGSGGGEAGLSAGATNGILKWIAGGAMMVTGATMVMVLSQAPTDEDQDDFSPTSAVDEVAQPPAERVDSEVPLQQVVETESAPAGQEVDERGRAAASKTASPGPVVARPERVARPKPASKRPRAPHRLPRKLAARPTGEMRRLDKQPTAAQGMLADELQLLGGARSALLRGEPDAAMAAVEEHAGKFSAGQLAEERMALRVQALTALGRHEEASLAASTMEERFPRSLLLPAIKRAMKAARAR